MKSLVLISLALTLVLTGGCKPKPMDIPPLQRKEAANLASEAQFATALRDYARAEPLFDKAAKLCPDQGEYWVNLGMTRRRLGNTTGAKAAYEQARKAYRRAFEIDETDGEPLLQEVYVLALLGQPDEARKALERASKRLPNDREVRVFIDNKQLDRILADPGFKDVAL